MREYVLVLPGRTTGLPILARCPLEAERKRAFFSLTYGVAVELRPID